MPTVVPAVDTNTDVTVAWAAAVAAAVAELQTDAKMLGPVACTLATGWTNYASSHSYVQVSRVGPLVTMQGLALRTGAAAAGLVVTVPVGYRPHASAVAPLGGQLIFPAVTSSGMSRFDVATSGSASVNLSIGTNGWVSINSSWIGE